jgi:hypothetical protein
MSHSLAWDSVTHADVVRAIEEYHQLGPERFSSDLEPIAARGNALVTHVSYRVVR